ncbi:MAG: hypothetical protein LBL57_01125 [Tannerella sp.]|jgi:hypothetical protein|nr:hypothetical protein [Tannerella sp.]
MSKESIPGTITGFTEYIKIAYQKALTNLSVYGIPSTKIMKVAVIIMKRLSESDAFRWKTVVLR